MKLFFVIFCALSCFKLIKNQNISMFMKDYTHHSYEPKISKMFSKLLRKYDNFTIIFHTENKTVQYVGIVINYFNYNSTYYENIHLTSYLVYNHDTRTTDQVYSRPNANGIVNFLFTKKWPFWKSLAVPEKINSNDVVIFVAIGNGTVLKTVDRKGIEFIKLAGKTLLIEILPHHGVNFYDTCYYCGNRSMQYHFIEKTHDSHLKTGINHFMPSTFRNLHQHKFVIVFMTYFPFVYCKQNITKKIRGQKTIVCTDLQGIESHMLKTISKKLNFTFEVHILPAESSFLNMIEVISAFQADIAFGGISMTIDRVPLVQFTKQYNSEEFTFLYLFSINLKEVFIKFIEPFNAISVWVLYIVAVFAISILLFVSLKMRNQNYVSYGDCIYIIFRGSFEQATPGISSFYRRRTTIALTFGLWWWTCLIVNTVYRSTVLSTVVNPPSLEPDDMSQLLGAGYRFVANQQFEDVVKDLLMVPDPVYAEALRKIVYGKDTCNVFETILQDHIAMLDETSTIQFEIRQKCPSPGRETVKWLRIGRFGLRSTGHAWATQRGAPFRAAIDYYLNLIISGGLFKKWSSDATMNYRKTMIPRSREAVNKRFRSLTIKRFYPLLTVYLAGIVFSMVVFLFEIAYYNVIH